MRIGIVNLLWPVVVRGRDFSTKQMKLTISAVSFRYSMNYNACPLSIPVLITNNGLPFTNY
jgi:hypothetical protein